MTQLLTQQDLAQRWQVSVRAIENWRKEGLLEPCKGVPVIRFSEDYIAKLEGVELKKTSPLQVRKLEIEIKRLRQENEELKRTLARISAEASKVYIMEKEEVS